jgi:hypothetical protein
VSAFDPRRPQFKKRVITASVTAEQDAEFERIKEALGVDSDGAVIKQALYDLSVKLFPEGADDAR